MAIGLGRMFGFTTPENFTYPYISKSIREFWRRWHITLSEWFRDYLYIPLGGNRCGPYRTYLNLLVVFFLCGLWHGAGWTFIVWGLWHGLFLLFERTKWGERLTALRGVNHVYTCLAFVFGWVFFRAANLGHAVSYFQALFGLNTTVQTQSFWSLINLKIIVLIVIGIIGCTEAVKAMALKAAARAESRPFILEAYHKLGMMVIFAILILSLSALAVDINRPFIYFKF